MYSTRVLVEAENIVQWHTVWGFVEETVVCRKYILECVLRMGGSVYTNIVLE